MLSKQGPDKIVLHRIRLRTWNTFRVSSLSKVLDSNGLVSHCWLVVIHNPMEHTFDNGGFEPPNGSPIRMSDDDSNFKTHYKNFENKPPPPTGWNLFRASEQDRGSVS